MAKKKIALIEIDDSMSVSKKAYEDISKKANILQIKTESNQLVLNYESKSGNVKGEMRLNNLKGGHKS